MATSAAPSSLNDIRRRAQPSTREQRVGMLAPVGIVMLAVTLALALVTTDGARRLAHSWLLNGWFALSISLGALFFIAIQHLVRAGWSVSVRRVAETIGASVTTPLILMAPLAMLVVLGNSDLFPWNDPEVVAGDKILEGKAPYLNAPFFLLRSLLYAAAWIYCGRWFLRTSLGQDARGDSELTLRLERRSAPILIVLGVTISFAAFDWLMSLDPHWFSTIFGIYAFSGAMVAGLAVISLMAAVFIRRNVTSAINREHLHDVVKLLYGMNCFWAYIAFSQYMLIWYANIPEETVWLKHRQEFGWNTIQIVLSVGHFVVPFIVLMPRAAKRNTGLVIVMCVGLLAMHWIDLYWIVFPQFAKTPVFGLVEILTAIGFVTLLAATIARLLRTHAIIPIQDPRLPESVAHVVH